MTSTPTIQENLTREKNDSLVEGKIKYLSTAEAYDLWSEVYDTDGNFLQALDTIEMKTLLPRAISLAEAQQRASKDGQPKIKAVDLGCGTGRNTLQLLDFPSVDQIVGLELSPKMMQIAQQACEAKLKDSGRETHLAFSTFDMLKQPVPLELVGQIDLVISTLVIEHVPVDEFFHTTTQILRPGGLLLLTNMHGEMGSISQAGFIDPKTGEKIRPVSYAHALDHVVEMAKENGFEVVEDGWGDEGDCSEGRVVANVKGLKEIMVTENLAEKLGVRGKKWTGVTVWFGGLLQKVR